MSDVMCACGCGLPAPVPKQSCSRGGWVIGVPRPYRQGHHYRGRTPSGYRTVKAADGGTRKTHRVLAERALGHSLPPNAQVHHVDCDPHSASPRLVICQDGGYHQLLHMRTRIVRAGGHPDTHHFCKTCGALPLSEFQVEKAGLRCKACKAKYNAAWYQRKRADWQTREFAAIVRFERKR